MPGLVPGIHVVTNRYFASEIDVDGRNKCGHDEP